MGETTHPGRPTDSTQAARLRQAVAQAGAIVPASVVTTAEGAWAIVRTPAGKRLTILPAAGGVEVLDAFEGDRSEPGGAPLLVGPLTARNAAALRRHLPWLAPRPLPPGTSAGFGDRLGLATPGVRRYASNVSTLRVS